MSTLGVRLRAYREAAGMSQRELGEKMHLTRQTISKWENDRSLPSITDLIFLADCYQLSLDELVGRSEPQSRWLPLLRKVKRRERINMLKKRTKTVCGLVAAIFLLLYSWKFVQSIQVVAETADLNPGSTLLLYGIKELNRGHSGKVEQIILKNGSVIKAPVTIEKLNAQQLLEPTKIAVPTQKDREDGHVIYLRELAR